MVFAGRHILYPFSKTIYSHGGTKGFSACIFTKNWCDLLGNGGHWPFQPLKCETTWNVHTLHIWSHIYQPAWSQKWDKLPEKSGIFGLKVGHSNKLAENVVPPNSKKRDRVKKKWDSGKFGPKITTVPLKAGQLKSMQLSIMEYIIC